MAAGDAFSVLEMLFAYLAANTALMGAVTTSSVRRFYGDPGLPVDYEGQTALLLTGGGGPLERGIPLGLADVQFNCYGPNPAAAMAVVLKLDAALHQCKGQSVTVTGGTARIGNAWRTGGPLYTRDPELGWQWYAVTYRVRYSTQLMA